MNERAQAVDDLAFMRGLVAPRPTLQRAFGESYLAGGLMYGGQMVLHVGQMAGIVPATPLFALAIGVGPTVAFICVLIWILRRHRAERTAAPIDRAVQAAFAALGLANIALIAIIGAAALRQHSLAVWLLFPCAVFVLQGAGWTVLFVLRRIPWHGLVAGGWFAAGIGLGLATNDLAAYMLIAGAALFGLMAAPGGAMIALSRRAE